MLPTTPSSADGVGSGGLFVATSPRTVFDTRNGVGGSSSAFAAGETRSYDVASVLGVSPDEVSAVMVSVTAHSSTSDTGYAFMGASDAALNSSVIRFSPDTVPTTATATSAVGPDGRIKVRNANGTSHLRAVVVGYFTAVGPSGAAPGGFVAVEPYRVASTRTRLGGVPSVELGAGQSLSVKVTSPSGPIPEGATAAFLSLITFNADADGSLTAYANGQTRPSVATLSYGAGLNTQNGSMVPLGADGSIRIHNNGAQSVDVAVDAFGYTSADPTAGGGYTPLVTAQVFNATIKPGQTRPVAIAGTNGIPLGRVDSVLVSAIAMDYTSSGTFDMTPSPTAKALPSVRFNTAESGPRSATALTRVGSDGRIYITNTGDAAATARINVQGWFASSEATIGDGFYPLEQRTVLDRGVEQGSPMQGGTAESIQLADVADGRTPTPDDGDPGEEAAPVTLLDVPQGANSVLVNVHIRDANGTGGLFRVYATDDTAGPSAGIALPYAPDGVVTSTIRVPLSADGRISIQPMADGSLATVRVELQGYFDGVDTKYHQVNRRSLLGESRKTLTAGETVFVPAEAFAPSPEGKIETGVAVLLSAQGPDENGQVSIASPDDTLQRNYAVSLDGTEANPARNLVVVARGEESRSLVVTNNSAAEAVVELEQWGWTELLLSDDPLPELPVDPDSSSDPTIDAILQLWTEATEESVNATITELAAQTGWPRSKTAEALLAEARAQADDVKEEIVDSEVASGGDTTSARAVIAAKGDGGRLAALPPALKWGDVVTAPNVSRGMLVGHAGIFRGEDSIVQAPGYGSRVQIFHRTRPGMFATGAAMQHVVYLDGRLASAAKRRGAWTWAESRAGRYNGDRYRSVKGPTDLWSRVARGPTVRVRTVPNSFGRPTAARVST